jgi:hypothetical protein
MGLTAGAMKLLFNGVNPAKDRHYLLQAIDVTVLCLAPSCKVILTLSDGAFSFKSIVFPQSHHIFDGGTFTTN